MTARPGRALVVALIVLAAMLPGAGAASAAAAPPGAGYRIDLYRRGDFVAQTNFVQCVGASMQMMLNMVGPKNDRTAGTQLRLQTLARSLSPSRPDGRIRNGASVVGWSDGLNALDAGPYLVTGGPTLDEVLRLAAIAMRQTGRPVGLLMWQGRHAWVMSGFRATADPRKTDDFRVTGVSVLDPLYPHGSTRWGPSPGPGQLLSVAQLGRQFVPRRSGRTASQWLAGFGGMYVVVLPYRAVGPARPPWPV